MADGRASASVVIVDPEKAARERDAAARALLRDEPTHILQQIVIKGLELTVPYTMKIVVESKDAERARELAETTLKESIHLADTILNNFNPNSEISLLNKLPVGQEHVMSVHLKKVVDCAQKVYNSSRGDFDPAIGPLLNLLRDAARKGTKPSREQIDALVSVCTLPKSFAIDKVKGTISRLHEAAAMDLGALNKGYIVDLVVEKLNEAKLENVFFEWGGDIRASGTNAMRLPWSVGINRPPSISELRSPSKEPPLICVLQLCDEALATSGDYENLVEGPGSKLYTSHYDWKAKRLLEPSETDLAQVSVKCYSCMYADALATASLLKRQAAPVRQMLDNWRYVRDTVTDFTAYYRKDERVARMHELATESPSARTKRISGSLPARVIVVGGGLAGQMAAIEAANCGASVILLEKEKTLGGNSAKATSGINAWGTRAQAKQYINDSGKYFERDTYLSGKGGNCDPGLVKMLSVKSADAIKTLTNLGVPLSILSQLGGHSHKRTHRAPDTKDGNPVPIGYTIMQTLEKHMRANLAHQITIMTGITVTSLIHTVHDRQDGARQVTVTGVELIESEGTVMKLQADSVILATGGFSNDRTVQSLMMEYAPHLAKFPTTNGKWATGDGVKMARQIGASLVDMDKVQLHPTGLIDPKDPANKTKYLGPEALRGSGGILLNKNGERFVNELDLRSVVSKAILEQNNVFPNSDDSRFAFCVLNDAARKLFGVNSHAFYWKRLGLFVECVDLPSLAKLIGCNESRLKATLEAYESVSSKKTQACPHTGKNVFPCVIGPSGPFYVAYITPSIHYTMGGCLISPSAEIQSFDATSTGLFGSRRPILGLFGAGEVTGGVHGGNRLGGNSLLECAVFGKIAGDRAATILQKKKHALSMKEWTTVTLREVREGGVYGQGSKVLRFNLPGALQRSGLALGQFIGIRGEWDGKQLIGYYSPITLPDDCGVIGILARSDKGNLREWISALQPGDAVEMKACGGLIIERDFLHRTFIFKGHKIRKLALIAGGTGIAPMLQIIRAALKKPFIGSIESIHLIYAAEDVQELTYRDVLETYQKESNDKFHCTFVLNHPPPQWMDGVGFIDNSVLRKSVQAPTNDLLIAICGPPIMQRILKSNLKQLGYNMKLVRTVDEEDVPSKM